MPTMSTTPTVLATLNKNVEGTYDLILEGFSPFVDSTSLHVRAGTECKASAILEVSYEAFFDNKTSETTDIDAHRQELVRLDKQLAWLDGRALKLMSQDGQISDLDPLHEFMDFYHTSLQKLHERKSNEGNEIKRLIQRLDRLEEKVTESDFDVLIHGRNEHREMIITVHIDRSNIDVNLEVSYFISNCSCSASYDNTPNVFITSQEQVSTDSNKVLAEDELDTPNIIYASSTSTETSMLSVTFTIPRRTTIHTDGTPHRVTIGVLDFNSKFIYTIIPKLWIHAYLNVSTINTSNKQLVAGPAASFMNNHFVTHSSIGIICIDGKFDLPLGTDAGIKVDCQPVKTIIDTQGLISKTYFENIRREIRLFNTKPIEVIVCVYDRISLSLDERIKVKLVVPDLRMKEPIPSYYVTLNDADNLHWKCLVQTGSECQLSLEDTLEWSTDKCIELREESE
ncbi:unnamed protein product [Rotaria socialis]|uniref:DUF4139 domain-containing protein n=2 Tax=Rotaria socialis TaxID=392032 RepID=A0A819VRF9_9BILA|nr:unnamed protein product [Rotaria socialis]